MLYTNSKEFMDVLRMSQVTALDNGISMCDRLCGVLLHASRFLALPHAPRSVKRTLNSRISVLMKVYNIHIFSYVTLLITSSYMYHTLCIIV